MLILGLLLLACTAAFTGLVLADNLNGGPDYNVTVLDHHIATMNSLAVFCAGLALAVIFGLGVLMALGGLSLRRRTSRKFAAARRDATEAARERDELAARLDKGATAEPAAYPAAGTADSPTAGARERDLAANRDLTSSGASRADQGPRRRHLFFGH
jgi:hypothetical protein